MAFHHLYSGGPGLLTANLSHTTLRKLAWYLQAPSNVNLDAYFEALPVNEEKAIVNFSKYTRALAGEDPESVPDDALEEKRFRSSNNPSASYGSSGMSGIAAAVAHVQTQSTTNINGNATEKQHKREAQAASHSTKSTSNGSSGMASIERAAATLNGASLGGGEERTVKRRKTERGDRERSNAAAGGGTASSSSSLSFPIVEEGRKVAAKVDDKWIMMCVIKYSKRNKVYTLEDADDQADKKEAHEVARDLVIPLASPEYHPPVFSAGSRVLAVFPGTTSFYPALVTKSAKRAVSAANKLQQQNGSKPMYDYFLQFDDDDEDDDGQITVKKVKGEFVIDEVVA